MDEKATINTAPPPPSEVKIRTMQSDLASMRASGGGAPKFRNVAVAGLTLDTQQAAPSATNQTTIAVAPQSVYEPPKIPVTHEVGSAEDTKSHFLPMVITIAVGVIALIIVGYVAYITFVK